jgi:hypothetical protein
MTQRGGLSPQLLRSAFPKVQMTEFYNSSSDFDRHVFCDNDHTDTIGIPRGNFGGATGTLDHTLNVFT